jgi:hypothetical protein
MPLSRALGLIAQGEISCGFTMIGLLSYSQFIANK